MEAFLQLSTPCGVTLVMLFGSRRGPMLQVMFQVKRRRWRACVVAVFVLAGGLIANESSQDESLNQSHD
jgi:hypothetical protein